MFQLGPVLIQGAEELGWLFGYPTPAINMHYIKTEFVCFKNRVRFEKNYRSYSTSNYQMR